MKGFTLIELIVVIAIIGVLAAILVPSMVRYVADSKLSTANANAKLVYSNTATYCVACGADGCPMASAVHANIDLAQGEPGQPYLRDGTYEQLTEALRSLMGGTAKAGIATTVISAEGVPLRSAWTKSSGDSYVGGYPREATDRTGHDGGISMADGSPT